MSGPICSSSTSLRPRCWEPWFGQLLSLPTCLPPIHGYCSFPGVGQEIAEPSTCSLTSLLCTMLRCWNLFSIITVQPSEPGVARCGAELNTGENGLWALWPIYAPVPSYTCHGCRTENAFAGTQKGSPSGMGSRTHFVSFRICSPGFLAECPRQGEGLKADPMEGLQV